MTRGTAALKSQLTKDFKDIRLILPEPDRPARVIDTGIPSLNVALGTGGFREGRFVMVHGGESSGKTTISLQLSAIVQHLGGVAVYLDFENKLDLDYAAVLGVDTDSLILIPPKTIEQGFSIAEKTLKMVREGVDDEEPDIDCPVAIVWDSLQAAPSMKSVKSDYEDNAWNYEAGSYSRCLRKFIPSLSEYNGVLVGISQVRIDQSHTPVGRQRQKEIVGVGRACGHWASQIVDFRYIRPHGNVKSGRTGNDVEVLITKNQLADPLKKAKFPIIYGYGVDQPISLLEACLDLGLAEPSGGAYYTLFVNGKTYKVNGKPGMQSFPDREPEAYDALLEAVQQKVIGGE